MVSLFAQAVESFLVHVFGLEQNWFHEVVACSQPRPDLPSLSHETVGSAFLLAGIGEAVAMTAAKIFPTINNSRSSIATGTKKPLPMASIVAWCPGKKDFIFNTFPFTTVSSVTIDKNKPVGFYSEAN
jgi:hypothetical protein